MMATGPETIHAFLAAEREDQTRFLAELVKVPSDNPPGDCQAHAERAAALLEALGFEVERHAVPEALVRENGMVRATNLVVRRRFGDGPVIALNAHGDQALGTLVAGCSHALIAMTPVRKNQHGLLGASIRCGQKQVRDRGAMHAVAV